MSEFLTVYRVIIEKLT